MLLTKKSFLFLPEQQSIMKNTPGNKKNSMNQIVAQQLSPPSLSLLLLSSPTIS